MKDERPILEDINGLIYQEEFKFGSFNLTGKIIKLVSGVLSAYYFSVGVIGFLLGGLIANFSAMEYKEILQKVNSDNLHKFTNQYDDVETFKEDLQHAIDALEHPAAGVVIGFFMAIVSFLLGSAALTVFLTQVPKEYKPIIKKINEYDNSTKKELKRMLKKLDKKHNCQEEPGCIAKMAKEFKKEVKSSTLPEKDNIVNDIEEFEEIINRKLR